MKTAVLGEYTGNPGDLSWKGLEGLGKLTVYDRTSEEQVVRHVGRAEAVYTNKTPISTQIIKNCLNLQFIGVLITGYNIVDIHVVEEAGVAVSNTPSCGADAVTQYVIALLLELCHYTGSHVDYVKTREWTHCKDWCFRKYPLTEFTGKTMGIIGFERTRRRTTAIAETPGMKMLAYDRYQGEDLKTDNCRYVDLEELLTCSDVISLHRPLFPETGKIISRQAVTRMRGGVLIINTSGGKLVREADLREGFDDGKIGGAAVDVVLTESIQKGNPLLRVKNILITLHIAWVPREPRRRSMDIVVENLIQFTADTLQHVVNKP